jgi:hypothetical protein
LLMNIMQHVDLGCSDFVTERGASSIALLLVAVFFLVQSPRFEFIQLFS